MKESIFPKKIVDFRGVSYADNLFVHKELQIGLCEPNISVASKDGYVVMDFGAEMCGGIRILTFRGESSRVRIRFGESLAECCSELGGAKNATNDHSLRDFCVELPILSDMTFGDTGFRFVRIDFFDRTEIKSIVAVNNIYKRPARYCYCGNDELIARIYKAAKRTVDLCASKGYVWDGIKRDRLVWVGDMHPEMLALTSLYGRVPALEKSLDFVKKQTPLPAWMNDFPMYSMWWIIILADYYEKTNAIDFTKKQIDYLKGLIVQISRCVKESGELDYPSCFVDWPTYGKTDEIHGVRAINIIAIKKAVILLDAFGEDTALAKELLDRLLKIGISPKFAKQVAGLKYFATELSDEDKKLLVSGGAKGMSTFMSYYILKAVASFDRQKAIEMMKEYYGAMLDKGATTFWEDFDIEWAKDSCRIDAFPEIGEKDIHGDFGDYCYKGFRHSLCHGWSAGVIQFIKEECN